MPTDFAAQFPIGTRVRYKHIAEHGDEHPDTPQEGVGVVVSYDTMFEDDEEADLWGVVELENGPTVEAHVNELTFL